MNIREFKTLLELMRIDYTISMTEDPHVVKISFPNPKFMETKE